MSKTIRVIYLLNKIANGEELPEKIEYSGKEWRLGKNDNKDTDYINDKNIGLFYEYLDSILIESLNDNVEIIEESIDIQNIEEIKFRESDKEHLGFGVDLAHSKINELVQAVKQLDREIKEKEQWN